MKDDKYWLETLDAETYRVTRQGGTEYPFTGTLLNNKKTGIYHCICCKTPLFTSEQKYDSGCGWPAFFDALDKNKIKFLMDDSHGMHRTEVRCAECDAHLGHVFDDGPEPTGIRYCINSVCLDFNQADNVKPIKG